MFCLTQNKVGYSFQEQEISLPSPVHLKKLKTGICRFGKILSTRLLMGRTGQIQPNILPMFILQAQAKGLMLLTLWTQAMLSYVKQACHTPSQVNGLPRHSSAAHLPVYTVTTCLSGHPMRISM